MCFPRSQDLLTADRMKESQQKMISFSAGLEKYTGRISERGIIMGQITVEKNVDGIEGLCVITPTVHGDNRGYFMETYSKRDMEEAGIYVDFVQDNQSMSTKGVLRGLHFQKQFPQTKLVRAIKGSVFDVMFISFFLFSYAHFNVRIFHDQSNDFFIYDENN